MLGKKIRVITLFLFFSSSLAVSQKKSSIVDTKVDHSKLDLITFLPNKVSSLSSTTADILPNCKGIPSVKGKQDLKLQLIAKGFDSLTDIVFAPEDNDRIFVLEQNRAQIRVIYKGAVLPKPFLDISRLTSTGGERGLLGMAFHPAYAKNKKFYLYFTNNKGSVEIVEYKGGAIPNEADPKTKRTLLIIDQPASNHNGGAIRFGHDGYLYLGVGDGGFGGDPFGKIGNAQNLNTLLGKILRIDVDNQDSGLEYAIPKDNPYAAHSDYPKEIFHWGLRNPWRMSFDRKTGDLWIGDVGQNLAEEINIAPFGSKNLNFGWRCKEGILHFKDDANCAKADLVDPVVHLKQDHKNPPFFCSVMAGHMYRGCAMPDLHGTFFFGDYCRKQIYSFNWNGKTGSQSKTLPNISMSNLTSWGEDNDGELYLVNGVGEVYKIVPE
jgi:glucose/arabinose dehydrogenase